MLDVDKAAIYNLEQERYLALDPWRHFIARAWRRKRGDGRRQLFGECIFNDPAQLTPPDLKALMPNADGGAGTSDQNDKNENNQHDGDDNSDDKSAGDKSAGDKDRERDGDGKDRQDQTFDEGAWPIGPVSKVVSFLFFPQYTIRRSAFCQSFCKFCGCCVSGRDSDDENDSNAEDDPVEEKYSFSSGFDYHFDHFVSGTKRHEWPLRVGATETLSDAGMHVISKHFWWFLYIRTLKDTWTTIALYILKGICVGMYPLIQGRMVAALSDGTTAITAINDDPSITGDVSERRDKAELELGMWLGIYAAVFFVDRVLDWHANFTIPGSSVRSKFRFVLMGRMLKFKPLPPPGEAAYMMSDAIRLAIDNIWFPVFKVIGSWSSIITIFVVLIVKHHHSVSFKDMFLMFILPVIGLMVVTWLNYWIRSDSSADIARREYQWMGRILGYTAAAAEFGRERNYDLDQECTVFWRIVNSLRFREFHQFFWTMNTLHMFEIIARAIALPMIYICGTRVMRFDIQLGDFVTVLSANFAMIAAMTEIMSDLMKWPLGYEAVLRLAQVINSSDLKTAYHDSLTGHMTNQGFLREVDLARLIRIDPDKMRTIDLRRIRRMNLDDLAPIEVQRLQTLGVDLPTLVKVSQLTEIVEQFQMDEHKDQLPTHMDNMLQNGDDAAIEPTEPLLRDSNASGAAAPLQHRHARNDSGAAAGLQVPLSRNVSPATKKKFQRKSTGTIGQIWPGGRPDLTPHASTTLTTQLVSSPTSGQQHIIVDQNTYLGRVSCSLSSVGTNKAHPWLSPGPSSSSMGGTTIRPPHPMLSPGPSSSSMITNKAMRLRHAHSQSLSSIGTTKAKHLDLSSEVSGKHFDHPDHLSEISEEDDDDAPFFKVQFSKSDVI